MVHLPDEPWTLPSALDLDLDFGCPVMARQDETRNIKAPMLDHTE